jgi:hypothetical protein
MNGERVMSKLFRTHPTKKSVLFLGTESVASDKPHVCSDNIIAKYHDKPPDLQTHPFVWAPGIFKNKETWG